MSDENPRNRLGRAALKAYCENASAVKTKDGRSAAHHQRYSRGTVPVRVRNRTVTYHPIKDVLSSTGLTAATIRKWVRDKKITVHVMHGMIVFNKAETACIKRHTERFWETSKSRHTEMSEEFFTELRLALCAVRHALECYARCLPLTPEQTELLAPLNL